MFEAQQYQLIDFGGGEKLERFGDRVVRRQSPSVDGFAADKRDWKCDFQFRRDPQSSWQPAVEEGHQWSVRHGNKTFLLKQSPAGQVGVFPEQADNWKWIHRHREQIKGLKAINLFAYTGGTTMQLADCGVEVTHVDAARPVVQWARKNADQSQLLEKKIRWIVDDAIAYLQREIARGNQYEIVVADPPSFGRGPKNSVWKIKRDLGTLIELIAQAAPHLKMLILSCHTPEITAGDLKRQFASTIAGISGKGQPLSLKLVSQTKKELRSGECYRWTRF